MNLDQQEIKEFIDGIYAISKSIKHLGNGGASTDFGATEGHSMVLEEQLKNLSIAAGEAGESIGVSIETAMQNNFTSPNVIDSNFEAANIVDVIHQVANSINNLANAVEKLANKS